MSDSVPNPYEAPVTAGELQRSLSLPHTQTTLVMILTLLLGAQAAMAGVTALGCIALNVVTLPFETEDWVVSVTNQLATASAWFYWATLVPFGMFLVRANKNARAISNDPMQFTPASMVWWFVVPFLSLVRPYQAVSEVWARSTPEADYGELPMTSSLVGWWWAAWLLSSIGSRITTLLIRDADPAVHNVLAAYDNVVSLALCGLAVQLVRRLDQRQRACA